MSKIRSRRTLPRTQILLSTLGLGCVVRFPSLEGAGSNLALGQEGYFGNKVIGDVNSFADFWSWTHLASMGIGCSIVICGDETPRRLGLLPLVFPEMPYLYSEGLAEAVPEARAASQKLFKSSHCQMLCFLMLSDRATTSVLCLNDGYTLDTKSLLLCKMIT